MTISLRSEVAVGASNIAAFITLSTFTVEITRTCYLKSNY